MEYISVLLIGFLAMFDVRAEFPPEEILQLLKPVTEKCKAITGVDKGLVEDFGKGNMVDDMNLKCYMKCIFLELDVLNETTGFFRYDKMLNMVPHSLRSVVYEMGRNCVHFKGGEGIDLCQVSYDLHRCWQRADPEFRVKNSIKYSAPQQLYRFSIGHIRN